MARKIMPGLLQEKRSWPGISAPVHAGETYISGAAVYINANGELQECATDPATIKGFSANPAFSGPGRFVSDSDTTIAVTPATSADYSAGQAYEGDESTVFVGQMYSGTTLVVPTQAMVGDNYGITRLSDGTWTLDQVKTSAIYQRVTIFRIDTQLNLVFFKVMSTYVQA